MRLKYGRIVNDYFSKNILFSVCKRILKINQPMEKIWTRVWWYGILTSILAMYSWYGIPLYLLCSAKEWPQKHLDDWPTRWQSHL